MTTLTSDTDAITLRFPGPDRDLAATLTLPPGPGPHPAALLINGSGPVDRDGSAGKLKLGFGDQVAAALASAGVATLRYDKRGVGASRLLRDGTTAPSKDWRRAGLHDNADDAEAAFAALAARPEVDADAVFLLGHSEGAILAANIAVRALTGPASPAPAGVVLLGCPATPGDVTLRWQATLLPQSLPAPVRALFRLIRIDLATKVIKNAERVRRTTTDVARINGAQVNARWLREFIDHNPADDLAHLTVPVLAITGAKDLQVNPADLPRIADLVPGPVETWAAPDLTHILRIESGPASMRSYRKELREPIAPLLLDRVTGWLGQRLADRPDRTLPEEGR
ncbi:MAG: lysophospholipase [Actinomycetota bacterium]|nr:lysophospholipase [Actinomycetota bacterium]